MPHAVLVLCTLLFALAASGPAAAQTSGFTVECRSRDGHDNNRTQHTLTVDATSPSTVWLGVEYGGIFKSLDAGETWQRADTGITAYANSATGERCMQEMGRIVVDPSNPNHVLMSRVESPGTIAMPFSENAGVWKTTNGGVSWFQIIRPEMNASGSKALAIGPGGVIYHGVNNNRASWGGAPADLYNTIGVLYRSDDGGGTWRELPTGAPEGLRALGVWVNPANAAHVWLVVFFAPTGQPMQADQQWVYLETRDGGETWARGDSRFPASARIPADAAVSSRDFNRRFLATLALEGEQQSFVTVDGGATWLKTNPYLFTARYDPHDATGMHLVGYAPYAGNPGLYESRNGGVTWTRLANTPSEVDHQSNFGVRITEIVWHPADPNTLYMSASGGYAWKSTDGGRNWRTIFTVEQMRAITDVVSDAGGPVFSVPFVDQAQALAFYAFGTTLPSGVQNPTWEVETADPATPVYAAADGLVVNVADTSRGDQAVFILPFEDGPWEVAYDHVRDVRVTPGQRVTAGTQLGVTGVLGNGRGRTELQINNMRTQPTHAYCPAQFGTQAFNEVFVAVARRVNGSPVVCAAPAAVP
ncbi:MAG: peptidoglycan DD-metalloendopeptidase family protein [Vicinamibacterales bacterium]